MILDTVALSDLIDGNRALARVLGNSPRHDLPVIVLGEYRFGLLQSTKRERLEAALDLLEQESDILPIDAHTAREYATIRLQLERKGSPIPINDIWIAALARQHDLPIVSRDAHFSVVPGIKRIVW